MKNRKKLTGKFIHDKIKYHWNKQNFLDYFECTEEEFQNILYSTFDQKNSRSILKSIKQNNKIK